MIELKKGAILMTILLISYPVVAGFIDMLRERLNDDTQYLQALKESEIAHQKVQADRSWFVPYVQLDTMTLWKDGAFSLSMSPIMSLDIEGWKVSVSNTFDLDGGASWRGWEVSIGKNLFEFEDVKDLEETASYLQSIWDIKSNRNRIFKELVKEIFDAWIIREKLKLARKKVEIRREMHAKRLKGKDISVSEKEIAMEEKELLLLESSMKALEQQLVGSVEVNDGLLEETLESVHEIIGKGRYGEGWDRREDVKAQTLLMKASELRKERIILEYLPFVVFSLSWLENPAPAQHNLTVGISLNWSLIDRNEREVRVRTTDLEYRISKARLKKKLEELEDQWKVMKKKEETLSYEKKVKEIELSLIRSELEEAQRKSEMGSITREELELLEIGLKEKELEMKELEFEDILLKLDALILKGFDVVELLGVKR